MVVVVGVTVFVPQFIFLAVSHLLTRAEPTPPTPYPSSCCGCVSGRRRRTEPRLPPTRPPLTHRAAADGTARRAWRDGARGAALSSVSAIGGCDVITVAAKVVCVCVCDDERGVVAVAEASAGAHIHAHAHALLWA